MLHQFTKCTAASAVLATALSLAACDKPAPAPAPTPTPADPSAAGRPKDAVKDAAKDPAKDEVKISKENWPNGKLKYFYEMRRGADGKWNRNGIGRAYYDTGELEREGTYKDGTRVGQWKYFNPDGTLKSVEERGADGQGHG